MISFTLQCEIKRSFDRTDYNCFYFEINHVIVSYRWKKTDNLSCFYFVVKTNTFSSILNRRKNTITYLNIYKLIYNYETTNTQNIFMHRIRIPKRCNLMVFQLTFFMAKRAIYEVQVQNVLFFFLILSQKITKTLFFYKFHFFRNNFESLPI